MPISEEITLAAIFYFGQVFVFCKLITKNVLKWFLLMCKERAPGRCTNLQTFLVETILHHVFD